MLLTASVLLFACEGDSAKPSESKQASASNGSAEAAPKPSIDMPPVDAALAKQAVDALPSAAVAQRSALAARALTELEKDRLPASLIEGLDALVIAAPDQRAVLLAQSISTNIALLDEACDTNAAKFMQSLATMTPDGREAAVWSECKFERHGLLAEGERAAHDPMKAMVAHMALAHLQKGGPVSDDERALLKKMMIRSDEEPY